MEESIGKKMKKTFNYPGALLVFGLPIFLMGCLVLISKSSFYNLHPHDLSLGIMVDLLITVPVVYFFLIRRTKIPNTTVVLAVLIGVLVCSAILPSDRQQYLDQFKSWLLPMIEISILAYILFRVRQAIRQISLSAGRFPDFFTSLKRTCEQFLPKGMVYLVVTEIAVFYYGFVCWKRRKLEENEFSYHRDSGTVPLMAAIILIVAIETIVLHSLLQKWSPVAAWILTGISLYSGLQLFGFLKSMQKRPFSIEGDRLYLRYGIMSETEIDLRNVESVEISSTDLMPNKETRRLSFLGALESHNMVIRLKEENQLAGLYGRAMKYRNLAFYVDDKTGFRDLIEARLGNLNKK